MPLTESNKNPVEIIHSYSLHDNRYLNASNCFNPIVSFIHEWNVNAYELNLKGEPIIRLESLK